MNINMAIIEADAIELLTITILKGDGYFKGRGRVSRRYLDGSRPGT